VWQTFQPGLFLYEKCNQNIMKNAHDYIKFRLLIIKMTSPSLAYLRMWRAMKEQLK